MLNKKLIVRKINRKHVKKKSKGNRAARTINDPNLWHLVIQKGLQEELKNKVMGLVSQFLTNVCYNILSFLFIFKENLLISSPKI